MSQQQLKNIIEAALLAAGQPLSVDRLLTLFIDEYQPSRDEVLQALSSLSEDCEQRGIELREVSSGFRLHVKKEMSQWVSRLWEEKPARYSRALLETLSLIAYRQPITRGEIEDIRGVSVSSSTIKTLQEREWIRVVGHRDVPGKPAMYATTKQFLDYFNMKSLDELPPLAELRDLDTINAELDLADKNDDQANSQSDDDGLPPLVQDDLPVEEVAEVEGEAEPEQEMDTSDEAPQAEEVVAEEELSTESEQHNATSSTN